MNSSKQYNKLLRILSEKRCIKPKMGFTLSPSILTTIKKAQISKTTRLNSGRDRRLTKQCRLSSTIKNNPQIALLKLDNFYSLAEISSQGPSTRTYKRTLQQELTRLYKITM